jgi:hypothetical protein
LVYQDVDVSSWRFVANNFADVGILLQRTLYSPAADFVHPLTNGVHLGFLDGADDLVFFDKPSLFVTNLYVDRHASTLVALPCQIPEGKDKVAEQHNDRYESKDYFKNFKHGVIFFFCQQSTVNGQRTAVFYLFSKMVWNSFM